MKKGTFTKLFLSGNIFFLFFLIYKNSALVELSYQKQRAERLKEQLEEQKALLQQELCMIHNPAHVKEFAQATLHMNKVPLHKIKTVTL